MPEHADLAKQVEEWLTAAAVSSLTRAEVVQSLTGSLRRNLAYLARRARNGRHTAYDERLASDLEAVARAIVLLSDRPVAPRQEEAASAKGKQTLQVELWLRVENGSKFTRGKSKARQLIEERVLRQYSMQQPRPNRSEYLLTLRYATEEELERLIDDLLREASSIADRYNCFIEADVSALDGSERRW